MHPKYWVLPNSDGSYDIVRQRDYGAEPGPHCKVVSNHSTKEIAQEQCDLLNKKESICTN